MAAGNFKQITQSLRPNTQTLAPSVLLVNALVLFFQSGAGAPYYFPILSVINPKAVYLPLLSGDASASPPPPSGAPAPD